MSKGWQYKSGDWWVTCDVCSKQTRASDIRHRWDGLLVCEDDFELRHPQDFIKHKAEKISVPFSRPEPPDQFVDVGYIDLYVDEEYVVEDYAWEGFPRYYYLHQYIDFNYIAEEHSQ